MRVIAFGHESRVGKDTAAKFLVTFLRHNTKGLNIIKTSLAAPMKAMALGLYAQYGLMSLEFYEKEENAHLRYVKLPVINKTPVEIWIEYGMAVRGIYEDSWVDYLCYNNRNADILVISDLRFPNEGDRFIDAYNGWCYRILNPRVKKTGSVADIAMVGYQRWRGDVMNDGTLNDLNNKIEAIGKELISVL